MKKAQKIAKTKKAKKVDPSEEMMKRQPEGCIVGPVTESTKEATKAKKAPSLTPSTTEPTKAAKKAKKPLPPPVTPLLSKTVRLLKSPGEGELRGQAAAIVDILRAHKGRMTVGELIAAMEKKIPTTNKLGYRDVYVMNRPKLKAQGFIVEEVGQ